MDAAEIERHAELDVMSLGVFEVAWKDDSTRVCSGRGAVSGLRTLL